MAEAKAVAANQAAIEGSIATSDLVAFLEAVGRLAAARKAVTDNEKIVEEKRALLPEKVRKLLEGQGEINDEKPQKTGRKDSVQVDKAGKAKIQEVILATLKEGGSKGMTWADVKAKLGKVIKFPYSDSHVTAERKLLVDDKKIERKGDSPINSTWHLKK